MSVKTNAAKRFERYWCSKPVGTASKQARCHTCEIVNGYSKQFTSSKGLVVLWNPLIVTKVFFSIDMSETLKYYYKEKETYIKEFL